MTGLHFRTAIADLTPYVPGKPAEELMRERGLTSVIKLASNEGPWGPVPEAAAAIAADIDSLNRYPDGSAVVLRTALAARHGVDLEHVIVGHGADSIINNLSLAMLEPGDEVVFGWPSFPSYFLDAKMMGATPVMVPLDDADTYDLARMLDAITERTRIVYVCNPNNPTGTMVGRDALLQFLQAVPAHVLPVVDEAYFEYVDSADYPDTIQEAFTVLDRPVMVLRTFSKIYGLAGLRVGYAVAPRDVVAAVDKVRNAFDVTSLAQAAALASIGQEAAIAERARVTQEGRQALEHGLRDAGLRVTPSVANFVCARVNGRALDFYNALLDQGIIVRPLDPFGMPDAIRITVGTPEENEALIQAVRDSAMASVQ